MLKLQQLLKEMKKKKKSLLDQSHYLHSVNEFKQKKIIEK